VSDTPWTPGPWGVIEHIERGEGMVKAWSEVFAFAPNGIGGEHIAHVPDDLNARLIAKAPEMAELLGEFAGNRRGQLEDRARALLAEVRGE
jgi:hypothetical protein